MILSAAPVESSVFFISFLNSSEPDLAIVPRLLIKVYLSIPIPESKISIVFLSSSKKISISKAILSYAKDLIKILKLIKYNI